MSTVNSPTIFADTAPRYYAAGLNVIPLFAREKRPIPKDWSRFAETPVDAAQQEQWIVGNSQANIGLVLGKSSGLIMIDIDTDKKEVFDAIMAVLPPSPWKRLGKKGLMLAYKWSPIKTHRVKNISGETIVETLSSRTQCVLPPSIHPETLKPYEANCDLVDVLHQLVCLPENIEEILRQAVSNAGVELSHSGWSRVTEHVSAGSRDTTLTELAGLFAFAVVRGERTLKEAIGMLQAYHAEFIDNVAGDQVGVEKHVDNLIRFLHRDVQDKGKVLPRGWDEGFTKEQLQEMGVTLTEEDTEWSYDQIQQYLREQFEAHPNGKERSEAVERILAKVAKSNQLTKIDEDRVLKYIVDVSGLGVPITTFRGRLRELRTGDVRGTDHSEIARAVLKDLEQYNVVRCHNDKFMKWGGSHWVEMDKNYIKALISENYGHLDACKRSSDINGILNVLTYVAEQGIERRSVKGVNFANGFLTLELKLIPHDPDYGMVYTLPFRYMEEEAGKFPLFAKFLNDSWGRDQDFEQKMEAMQEALCVTLFGQGPRYQRAVLLHGAPKSGKSQMLRIMESLVPAEAKCSVPPNVWNDKFMPAQMHGKILNVCGELSEHKLIDGQSFKDIVDGQEISGQHKNQAIFTFRPSVTHWFASNHMPKSSDTSNGFIRRWLFLTFHYPVSAENKITDLGDIIASEEREAIVAWAAQAMPRLLRNNDYTLPASHKLISDELANVNNSVRYFVKESGKVKTGIEGVFSTETKLFNAYFAFCLSAGGSKPVSSTRFRAMMRELGPELDFELKVSAAAYGGTQAIYDRVSMVV
jgi:P4 family phage/plasmid primase-like protien